jgi:hypothetical protein
LPLRLDGWPFFVGGERRGEEGRGGEGRKREKMGIVRGRLCVGELEFWHQKGKANAKLTGWSSTTKPLLGGRVVFSLQGLWKVMTGSSTRVLLPLSLM